MRFDPQKAWVLLEVVRLSAGHPQLVNIKNEALEELNEMNADLGEPPDQAGLVQKAAFVEKGDPSRDEEPPVGLADETTSVERRA